MSTKVNLQCKWYYAYLQKTAMYRSGYYNNSFFSQAFDTYSCTVIVRPKKVKGLFALLA